MLRHYFSWTTAPLSFVLVTVQSWATEPLTWEWVGNGRSLKRDATCAASWSLPAMPGVFGTWEHCPAVPFHQRNHSTGKKFLLGEGQQCLISSSCFLTYWKRQVRKWVNDTLKMFQNIWTWSLDSKTSKY